MRPFGVPTEQGPSKSQPVCQKEKHVDISRYSMEYRYMGFRCRSDFCTAGTDYQTASQAQQVWERIPHNLISLLFRGVVVLCVVCLGFSKIFTTSKNSSCALFGSLVQAGRMFAFKILIFLGTVLTHQFRDTV